MSPLDSVGFESALMLLAVASFAAVQARAVRGAQRQIIQELCQARRKPDRYDQIVAASETIAFIAASVVVGTSVAATLLAFRGPLGAERPLALDLSAVAGWIALVWALLVVVPILLVRFAGPWIVVATWEIWRPIVAVIGPGVGLLGRFAAALGGLVGRKGAEPPRPGDELRIVVDEAHQLPDRAMEAASPALLQSMGLAVLALAAWPPSTRVRASMSSGSRLPRLARSRTCRSSMPRIRASSKKRRAASGTRHCTGRPPMAS
jgi:hypothetical protein